MSWNPLWDGLEPDAWGSYAGTTREAIAHGLQQNDDMLRGYRIDHPVSDQGELSIFRESRRFVGRCEMRRSYKGLP
jgi:hypothetical protein